MPRRLRDFETIRALLEARFCSLRPWAPQKPALKSALITVIETIFDILFERRSVLREGPISLLALKERSQLWVEPSIAY